MKRGEETMFEGMNIPSVQLAVLCTSVFFVFLAYESIQKIESSLNPGVGTTAIGVLYVVMICATPAAPYILKLLGKKWAYVFGGITYSIFVASHFYPKKDCMIPAAVVIGIGSAVFWPAILTLLKHFSDKYAAMKDLEANKTLDHFSSIFWGSFQLCKVVGSAMLYIIFKEVGLAVFFTSEKVLIISFTACALFGCLIGIALMQNVDKDINETRKGELENAEKDAKKLEEKSTSKSKAWFRLLRSPHCLMLFGICMYNGIEQGFAWTDFTSLMVYPAYNSKAMIGMFTLAYSAANMLTGSLASQFPTSKAMTRALLFVAIGTQTVCSLLVSQLFADKKAALWVTAVVLGMGDALLNTKIGVLLGCDFKGQEHVIMVAIWRGCHAAGTAIPFFLSGRTELLVNVLVLTGVAVVAVILFGIYCSLGPREEQETDECESTGQVKP